MYTTFRCILFGVLSIFLTAGGVEAQDEDGMGAILDWIHKLSGPQFIGFGLNAYHEFAGVPLREENPAHREPGIRLRLSTIYRTSIREAADVDPDNANITMLTIQPTVEFPITRIPLEFGVGVALNRFGGDADSFWHLSVPVLAQFRPRQASWRFVPRVGVAVHVFPGFSASDFAPLVVDVQRDAAEAVFELFVAVERHW
jgi:hypothetical protein